MLLLDDWRLTEEARIHEESFGAMGDWSHGGRTGNWTTVNGESAWTRTVSRHERLRLRLVNVANARIFSIGMRGLDGWLVALDGQPLAALEPVGSFALAPGQRADLFVDAVADEGEEALLFSREREGAFVLATLAVPGQRSRADAAGKGAHDREDRLRGGVLAGGAGSGSSAEMRGVMSFA